MPEFLLRDAVIGCRHARYRCDDFGSRVAEHAFRDFFSRDDHYDHTARPRLVLLCVYDRTKLAEATD
jgi:hypothetical protein